MKASSEMIFRSWNVIDYCKSRCILSRAKNYSAHNTCDYRGAIIASSKEVLAKDDCALYTHCTVFLLFNVGIAFKDRQLRLRSWYQGKSPNSSINKLQLLFACIDHTYSPSCGNKSPVTNRLWHDSGEVAFVWTIARVTIDRIEPRRPVPKFLLTHFNDFISPRQLRCQINSSLW